MIHQNCFSLCNEQLSSQSHYDFGLRALKYVLVSAGNIKRDHVQRIKEEQVRADWSAPSGAPPG